MTAFPSSDRSRTLQIVSREQDGQGNIVGLDDPQLTHPELSKRQIPPQLPRADRAASDSVTPFTGTDEIVFLLIHNRNR